jgi:two-component system, OmpR family, sensor kinase
VIHLTIKTRLVLWHSLWVVVILTVAAWISDWALAGIMREQIDHALLGVARHEIAMITRAPHEPLHIHEAAPRTTGPSFERLDKFVQITALDGAPIARSHTLGTARLPLHEATQERLRRGKAVYESVEDFGEEPIRMVSVPLSIGGARYAVQVAMSLDDARFVIRAARWLFLIVATAILTAIVVTGGLLARRALLPIDRVVTRARRIGESSLAERLPHPGTGDEIARLVETLNDMLARIERSFELQRRFTADASHELMSPLSRLRAELEVTLRRPRDPREYEETLRSCLEEVERLSGLTEELLGLARLDAGEGTDVATTTLPLAPIVEEAVQRFVNQASRRGVTLIAEPSPPLTVKAAPGAASLAVANIVDNAVKFSSPGGHVTVKAFAEGDEGVVAVTDGGPGVPQDEIPLLFERFYRGSAARVSEAPGIGLGLAISRMLIERQGGRISVDSMPGKGATFTIRLPIGRD